MSKRRRQSLAPTLFPFLAVLVCTLGTLILLLALVAQNTSDAAQELAQQPDAAPIVMSDELTVGDVQRLVAEEEFRLDQLVSFRDAQTGDLEVRRNQLAHVEDHMRRIRERLKEISDAMEQSDLETPTTAATKDELRALREQLAKEEQVVEKLREEIKTEKPRFVIVPHQGPNGTNRRPIYLECTSQGVTIWPEGVAITKWQLEHSSADANPLDDALRAARYHAMQQYGDTIPPYPMLLVRPAGVETYYAARAAMLDWDDQFGYELVPSEIELAYPKPDPAMREKMQYAVNEAVNRVSNRSIARSLIGRGNRTPGTRDPGRAAAGRGDSDHDSDGRGYGTGTAGQHAGSSPAQMPRLSVAEMDRQGRRSGFRDHRMFPTQTYGSSNTNSNTSSGRTPISSEAAKRRLERQLADSASAYDSASDQQLTDSAQTAVDEIRNSMNGQAEAGFDSQPGQLTNAESEAEAMQLNAAGSNTNHAFAADSSHPSTDPAGLQMPGNADTGGRSRQANSSSINNPGAFGPSSGALAGMTSTAQQSVSQQRQTANQDAASAQSNSPPRASAQTPTAATSPPAMVSRGGVDWALPSRVALGQGNEIIRSIRVQVHADRFVIPAGRGERASETFLIQSLGADQATLQMATAIRARIERWGAAAPGARWSPRLLVDVMPGAERRFNELGKLMTGSGLPIQRSTARQADVDQGESVR